MLTHSDFTLRWDHHNQARTLTVKSLWENEDFLDVTIACDDDQIEAHKVILSAASPFFKKILKRNPHSHPLLYLRGTTKKDMSDLLKFIYSGETQIIQEDLEKFMALAKSLEIQGLVGEMSEINNHDEKSEINSELQEILVEEGGRNILKTIQMILKRRVKSIIMRKQMSYSRERRENRAQSGSMEHD